MKVDFTESGEPARVLYVHNSADAYGASRSMLRMIAMLDRNRFEPLVVIPQEGDLAQQLRKNNVPVFIHPQLTIISRYINTPAKFIQFLINIPRSILFLKRLIRREKIALVHTNVGVIPSAALAASLAGVPHVWHIREFFSEFPFCWSIYWRYMTGFSRRVITVSKATADQFPYRDNVSVVNNGFFVNRWNKKNLAAGDDDPERVSVVHDGFEGREFEVNKTALRGEFRTKFNLNDEIVAGCVGRIKFQRKGQDIFIRAIGLLKRQGVIVRGLIVGAPFAANEQQWKAVKDLIAAEDVEKEIVLAGELKDVRPAYAAMDIFVLPSALPEPFGGVIMEAMGMHLPVIATNIGGSPEQVEEGVTGFLVPPNDPEALADAITRLAKNPDMRDLFGTAGFERLKDRFSLEKTTAQMEEVYAKILTAWSKPGRIK